MNELQEFWKMASNPDIPTKKVRKRMEQLQEKGIIHKQEPMPDNEELVFIEGKYELFWKHMVEERTFFGCECWTDGEIIGVYKNNTEAIKYILKLLEGKLVSGWKKEAEKDCYPARIVDVVRNNLAFVGDEPDRQFKQYRLKPFLHLSGWGCRIVTPEEECLEHFYKMPSDLDSYYFARENINKKENLKILADYEYYYEPNFDSYEVENILSLIEENKPDKYFIVASLIFCHLVKKKVELSPLYLEIIFDIKKSSLTRILNYLKSIKLIKWKNFLRNEEKMVLVESEFAKI